MYGRIQRMSLALGGLLLISMFAAGCSEIEPAPNEEGGGELNSPTHGQDSLREHDEKEGG